MEDVGLIFIGQEHSGLTDAQNTARLALQMVRDGAELTRSSAANI
jgi:inhibitor of KinA sporulation pathway (predicted exonuclease)